MKVLFRSDSSSQIGLGHIKRDLILAKQYNDVSLVCLSLEGPLIDEISYPVYELSSESVYELTNFTKEEKFELLIIDHYDISVDDEKPIKLETRVKTLSFDNEIKPRHCDILLNVNAYAKASDYEGLVPLRCEVRCGFSYALIREEFYQEAKENREKKYDFFIYMGGTNIENLSLQTASELLRTKIISVATSSSNPNLKKLQKFVKLHNNIRLFIDHENTAKLMNESNKLIISASSLVNEALLLKANFKAIRYVKNQESIVTWLAKKGYEVEYRY